MRLVFFSTPSIPVFCSCHQRNVNVSLYNESIGVGKEYLFTFFTSDNWIEIYKNLLGTGIV